ncbi:MAG: cysteine desulfurase [Oscillospiraceae bacterium]|jgi:cysteine desulfurase|nr:cysteine desulfurase [Oscillospiraceae bacterium]
MNAYLDNSATTPVSAEAILAMQQALQETWGNPSSRHALGLSAEEMLESARAAIAEKLAAQPEEITFTSGGTEANNLAVLGGAAAMRRRGNRVVITAVEHASVYESAEHLSKLGYDVVRLPVDQYGRISEDDLQRAITPGTILVSVMAVNNETGTCQPVDVVKRIIHANRAPALFHVDAVQAFGKLPVRPAEIDADLLTVSGHKIHGPKGVGALYIRKGVTVLPRVFGGSQEGKIRSGTEPLPAIAGFGAAADNLPDLQTAFTHVSALRDHLVQGLQSLGDVVVNSPPDALPHIVSFSVPGQKSEPMLNFLSQRGVYISSGSACSKGKPSRVLKAMNLAPRVLAGALRVSFTHTSTMDEADKLLWMLGEAMRTLIGQ